MLSVQQQQKWIKDGRGDGELSSYKPWLTVRDLSSLGRSHRVYGHKTKRTLSYAEETVQLNLVN